MVETTEKLAKELADSLQGVIDDGYLDMAVYGSGVIKISEKEYQKLIRQLESFKSTQKKYREKNKEYYREYHRKWQQDNRERVSQYQKEWRLKKKQIDLQNTCDNLETKGEMQ